MFRRNGPAGLILILAFVILYKFGEAIAGTMSNPLYIALGFSKVEIATVAKIYGVIATLAGVAIGGIMVLHLGIFRALLIGGVLQALSNLMYIVQVWAGHDVVVLALTIGTENLTNGIGSAAFVAYLSGLCNVAFTATQYALLSSLATVGVNILSASGGWLADRLGWIEFFFVSMGLTVPGLVLLVIVMRHPRLAPIAGASPAQAEAR
jgi:PAT family beta-lactamase induction signal transducer AmpG